MTWDSVPWFVGGGAQHSPEVARLLAYAATSGAEGIVTPGDLKVSQLAVAGSSIRVLAGACLLLNRNAAGAQQTYVGRNPSEDVKAIASTGAGVSRNDLIVARIKDPFLPGEPWADPADVTVGPYIFSEVIPNVAASVVVDNASATAYLKANGITGIPLAAAILPPNTTTITDTVLRDLRKLATPRNDRQIFMAGPTPEVAMQSAANAVWPDYRVNVPVPPWATHGYVIATLSSIGQRGGAAQGQLTGVLATLRTASITYDLDAPVSGGSRHTLVVGGGWSDVRSIAGTTVDLHLEAKQMNAGTNPGYLVTVAGTQVIYDVHFYERAV